MDRGQQSKVLSSEFAWTEKHIEQNQPIRSDRSYRQKSQAEQQTECFCCCYGRRQELDPSSRCRVHAPVEAPIALESPCSPVVPEKCKYSSASSSSSASASSSDSEMSSASEPPVKNDSDSKSTNGDASSDSSSSDSSESSSSTSTSNDDLVNPASAEVTNQSAAASLPRIVTIRAPASNTSLRSSVDRSTSSSSKAVSADAKLYYETMNFSPRNAEEKTEEEGEKEAIGETAEEIPASGYCLSSRQVAHQSRPRLTRPSIESGAADSSTDSGMNRSAHSVLGTRSHSGDEETGSLFRPLLPTAAGDGSSSLQPTEGVSRPRNLVRIVMKKSGVARGISAKKLTKNPVINIFGEIVFDGCTFEGESSRSPAERAAAGILAASERDKTELDLNSEEFRQRLCNDILQKEIRREIVDGRGRVGGLEDVLEKGIRRDTEEGRGGGVGVEAILQNGTSRETEGGRGRDEGVENAFRKERKREAGAERRRRGGGEEEDILQKETSRETGEGRGRRGRENDILQTIRRETGEPGRVGEKETEYKEEETDRQEMLVEGKGMEERTSSSLTVGTPNQSPNNFDYDFSKSPQVRSVVEISTERVPKRLVDYDDEDGVGSPGQGKSNSAEENTSPSALRKSQMKDLLETDGARSGQRNRKHLPEINRSCSEKRRHLSSTSPDDERRITHDDLERYPLSTFDVKTRAERTQNRDDRSSCTTGLEDLKSSDKKFSDFKSSDLRQRTAEKRERMWDDRERSESRSTRRNTPRVSSAATALKILGTRESTDPSAPSEVERKLRVKALASVKRSKSGENKDRESKEKGLSDSEELQRKKSRRSCRDSPRSKDSNERISSSQRSGSFAETFSPDSHRFRSRPKEGPRISPARRTTASERSPLKARRSESRHRDSEVRRRELCRSSSEHHRSSERKDDFASGKEKLGVPRRRGSETSSSDRKTTERALDEPRNVAISRSSDVGSRSAMDWSEQSGKTRSRSSASCNDASNRSSNGRRESSAWIPSLKSSPREDSSCFRDEQSKRERTGHTEAPGSTGIHRGDENRGIRPSGSRKVSSLEGLERVGVSWEGIRSSRDRTDTSDHCSQSDDHHHKVNYYPNNWFWSTRPPGHLKGTPEMYPFPYLHPFAQPFVPPMLRYNPYVYANYCNEESRRCFLAQQPSSFYPNYHRPHLPYWAPPLPQNLCPTYVPYATTPNQGDGFQYDDEDGGGQADGLVQDEIQEHESETVDDFRSATTNADQELLEEAAIQSSATPMSTRFDALGTATPPEQTRTTAKEEEEEECLSLSSAVQ